MEYRLPQNGHQDFRGEAKVIFSSRLVGAASNFARILVGLPFASSKTLARRNLGVRLIRGQRQSGRQVVSSSDG
ncbi:MAG: hypothetical protein ACRD5F_00770 [Candidatus Acidiferrales bacterium]